ncbi:MAG: DinB family protein [Acidobacteria bacterium]|nr:DinB family protein [Acidobacteriota bacterium]
MSQNAKTIESLVSGLCDEQINWKSAPEQWSISHIVYHLWRTEEKDFRSRLEKTLRDPQEEWTPLSPQEMRLEQIGDDNNLEKYLQNFLDEREKSIAWLKTLESPNLENTHQHQQMKLSAGDLLASWLSHDFLHIKQIARVHYDYINQISQPFKTDYAGKWT